MPSHDDDVAKSPSFGANHDDAHPYYDDSSSSFREMNLRSSTRDDGMERTVTSTTIEFVPHDPDSIDSEARRRHHAYERIKLLEHLATIQLRLQVLGAEMHEILDRLAALDGGILLRTSPAADDDRI